MGGFFLAWTYLKSESIAVPVLLHALGNLCALAAQVGTWYWNRGAWQFGRKAGVPIATRVVGALGREGAIGRASNNKFARGIAVEVCMGAEVLIRGKVGPGIVAAFRCSSLYRALSVKHTEVVLWGPLSPRQDGHSYCTVTSELNGVVRELAVIRFTDRLEEQIEGKFGEKVSAAVDAD